MTTGGVLLPWSLSEGAVSGPASGPGDPTATRRPKPNREYIRRSNHECDSPKSFVVRYFRSYYGLSETCRDT